MPDKANDLLPKAPDLSETAQAIARGRELVKQAQRLRDEVDRQIEGVQPPLSRQIAPSTVQTNSWATRRRAVRRRPRQHLRRTRGHNTSCAHESDARLDAESTVWCKHVAKSRIRHRA